MKTIKTIFHFDSNFGKPVAHSLSLPESYLMHSPTSLPNAEQCQRWGLVDVATFPDTPYSLSWFNAFKAWEQATLARNTKAAGAQNAWYEFARFANNMCEIYSPHHVTHDCLLEYFEHMVDNGLNQAAQKYRFETLGSIFRILAEKRILRSNPASELRPSILMH